jgi:glycosyltransferase involved in cell wall biosynthesis
MSAEPEPSRPACRRAALVVDHDALERFGPVVRLLAVGLIDERIRVTVIGPSGEGLGEVEWGPAQRIEHGSLRWPQRGPALRRVLGAIGQDRPDVVHGLTGSSQRLVEELAQTMGVPAVLSLTSEEEIVSASVRAAAVVRRWVVPSAPLERQARERHALAADRLACVPLGLVAEQQVNCFAAQHTNPVLVCQNPRTEPAGVLGLLQAVRGLVGEYPDLMLMVRGEGLHEAVIRRQVFALGLRDVVTFVPVAPQIREVFRLADIFVDPAAERALRVNGLQAMAHGLAVVAAAGGAADHYQHEATALTYPPASHETLRQHLARLLSDRDYARDLAGRGLEFVRQHRRASQMVGRLSQLYCELASAPRDPAG